MVTILLAVSATPTLAAFAALPFAVASVLKVRGGASGKELIPVLSMNGKAMLIWSVVTALAMAWVGWHLFGPAGGPVPYVS